MGSLKFAASFLLGALVAFGLTLLTKPNSRILSTIETRVGQQLVSPREDANEAVVESSYTPSVAPDRVSAPTIKDALSSPDRFQRRKALTARAIHLAHEDLEAAIVEGGSLIGFLDQSTYLQAVVKEWAKQDPKAAFDFATTIKSNAMGISLAEAALETISATQPEVAAELCGGLTTKGLRENLVAKVAYDYALSNPTEAAAWALSLTDSSSRMMAASQAAKAWAESSPEEAIAWAKNLPEANLRSESIRSAYAAWAGEDLGAALVDTAALHDVATKDLAIESISQNAGFDQPETVLNWLVAQPQSDRYFGEMAAVLSYLTESSPDAATARIESLPPEFRSHAVATIAGTWVASQPQETLKWVTSISDPDLKMEAMRGAAALWAENQLDLALDYSMKVRDPALRDAALVGVVESVNNTDSPRAFTLATQIANAETRRQILSGVLDQIASQQPEEVTRLIDAAPLSGVDRIFLRDSVNQQSAKPLLHR